MALSSFLKPNKICYPARYHLRLLHPFSSSSSNDPPGPDDQNPGRHPHRDALRQIKAKLKLNPPGRPIQPNNAAAYENINKDLPEFRRRTAAPETGPPYLSDLYQKGYQNRPVRARTSTPFSRSPSNSLAGNTSPGKETRFNSLIGKRTGDNTEELGRKLAELRPDAAERERREKEGGGGGGWFSLEELRDRLKRLREIEKESAQAKPRGIYSQLQSLIEQDENAKKKPEKSQFQNSPLFGSMGEASDCMKGPPKDHLVEKYFHPDNMSASEKLKIELAKVRDEFKMSESDCGSARVQVAQLTTKIKYLSSVLKKKDKHSLKGLQAMVQQRKKLLKYLRRTDWDSYCFVLDKLGLRDNADFKLRS